MIEPVELEQYLYDKASSGTNGAVRSRFGMCPDDDLDDDWDPTKDPNILVKNADCSEFKSGYTDGEKPYFLNLNGWYAVQFRTDFGETFRWAILYLKSVVGEDD